jgi:hypothetical protein
MSFFKRLRWDINIRKFLFFLSCRRLVSDQRRFEFSCFSLLRYAAAFRIFPYFLNCFFWQYYYSLVKRKFKGRLLNFSLERIGV